MSYLNIINKIAEIAEKPIVELIDLKEINSKLILLDTIEEFSLEQRFFMTQIYDSSINLDSFDKNKIIQACKELNCL